MNHNNDSWSAHDCCSMTLNYYYMVGSQPFLNDYDHTMSDSYSQYFIKKRKKENSICINI